MRFLNRLKINSKLVANALIVSVLVAAIAAFAYLEMKSLEIGVSGLYYGHTLPLQSLEQVISMRWKMRGDVYRFLAVAGVQDEMELAISQSAAQIEALMRAYSAGAELPEEQAQLAVFEENWAIYYRGVEKILAASRARDSVAASRWTPPWPSCVKSKANRPKSTTLRAKAASRFPPAGFWPGPP